MSWRSLRSRDGLRQIAVVDLGSNSWRLVVFSYAPGAWWKRTDELYETVRIGAGMNDSGELSRAAIVRGLETLTVFERFCQAHGLHRDEIQAVATSAIREAGNREEFLQRARRGSGLAIEVLSGGGGPLRLHRRRQHNYPDRRRRRRARRR